MGKVIIIKWIKSIVDVLGITAKNLKKKKKFGRIETIQTAALLKSRIPWRVLES